MAQFKGSIKGVLIFLFAILFIYVTWYWISPLANLLPINTLKIIFWIGLVGVIFMGLLAGPMSMIMKDQGKGKDLILGGGAWLVGNIINLISYYIVPPILNALPATANYTDEIKSTIWIGVAIFWVLAGIVVPIYFMGRSLALDKIMKR